MKKIIITAFMLCIVMSGCAQKENGILSSGTVEADEYDVFSQIQGKIIEIKKQEGDSIKKDDVVVVIDNTDAINSKRQAEANLRIAQAKLDSMLAGNRPEQIEQARANLNAAKANLADLEAGSRPEQIKAAQAVSDQAKANLDNLKSGNRKQQIEQSQYQVSQAKSALENAQENFDFQQKIFEDTQTLYTAGAASKQQLDAAQLSLNSARAQLSSANGQLNIAISQNDLLESGATPEAIAAAEAQYNQALANLELLKNGATQQSVTAAQAQVDQAQASLDYLMNGYSKQDIEQAEAGVDAATAYLENAQNQLAKYEIKSPIDGIMLYKNMEVGQVVNMSSNVFTVEAVNNYWIKVYIPQKYNGSVKVGDNAEIQVSNLKNQVIGGKVTWISPKAEFTPRNIETTEAKQEKTVFAVKVKVTDHLDLLTPGMNATVVLGE